MAHRRGAARPVDPRGLRRRRRRQRSSGGAAAVAAAATISPSRTGPATSTDQSSSDFQKTTGIKRRLHRGHQRQQRVLRQDPAQPARKGKGTGRDGMVLTDWMASRLINQVDPPWVQPLRRGEVPEQDEPASRRCRTRLRPDAQVHAAVATGMTGIAYNIKLTGKEIKTIDDFLAVSRDEDGAHRDARHRRAVHARRATTRPKPTYDGGAARVRQAREGGERRQDRRVQRQRVRRTTSAPGTSPPRSRGRATSRRSRSTTPTCASRSRTRAACSGPTTS